MDFADIEGDALAVYRFAGADADEPPSIARLCELVTGFLPRYARMRPDGKCAVDDYGDLRVSVRPSLPARRARFVVAHEIAEWWYMRNNYACLDIEDRCNALGAALVVPRPAAQQVLREAGHSPMMLAQVFGVERCLALLRIGEVTGRPVALLRKCPIFRGEAFEWPQDPVELERLVREPAPEIHPVRLEQRWGLMARW